MKDYKPETPVIGAKLWTKLAWIAACLFSFCASFSIWIAILNCSPSLTIFHVASATWLPILFAIATLKLIAVWRPSIKAFIAWFINRYALIAINNFNTLLIVSWSYFNIISPSYTTVSDLHPLPINNAYQPKVLENRYRYGISESLVFYPEGYSTFEFVLKNNAFSNIDNSLLNDLLASDSLTLYITQTDADKILNGAMEPTFIQCCMCHTQINVYAFTSSKHEYVPPTENTLKQAHKMGWIRVILIIILLVLLPWVTSMFIGNVYSQTDNKVA